MCRNCCETKTETIRRALFHLGLAFDAKFDFPTSLHRMKIVDQFIKRKICKHWERTSPPLYMNAANSMERYQRFIIDEYKEKKLSRIST